MKYLFIFVLAISSFVSAQNETLSIVSYNLLYFPDGRNDCGTNAVIPNRVDTLKKITDYLQPDIFLVCEIQTQAGVNKILNNALNANGNTNYAAAVFNGNSELKNAMFYNKNKLTLQSQHILPGSPRIIDHYVLYLKDPNLGVFYDTTFIEVFMVHLKHGNTPIGESQRAGQTQILMNYIATRPTDRNIIVAGDLNVYSSSSVSYQNLVTGSFALKDPINKPGNWSQNPTFSAIHTQSTRTNQSLDCGAQGGMDDRFDHILVSQNVMSNANHVKYETGSYRAIGQDGNRFGNSLISPPNTMYPQSLVNAMYHMSDHLPVELKVKVTYPTGNGLALVPSYTNTLCNGGEDGSATITPNQGQPPYTYLWDANANNQTTQTATNLSEGTYCVTVIDNLGEDDTYCVTVGQPDPISYNSFITPDPEGDCNGDIQIIVGGGVEPYTYSWTDFPGNTSANADDLCMGNYEFIITDYNGCEFVINAQVGGVLGLTSEFNGEPMIDLYPNPVKEKLRIHTEKPVQEIKVLTITGLEIDVQITVVKKHLIELNTTVLSEGTYIIMIKSDDVWLSSRIVKY